MKFKYAMSGLILTGFLAFGSGCEYWETTSEQPPASPGPTDPGAPASDIPADWKWVWGTDISHWPVTINLKSAVVTQKDSQPHRVTLDYDRLQNIPAWNVPGDPDNAHNVNGSLWLIREYNGQWHIGTIDYLRVGQMSKTFMSSPQFLFMPKRGDRIGFMVSTMNRSYNGTISGGVTYRERSNIVWVTW